MSAAAPPEAQVRDPTTKRLAATTAPTDRRNRDDGRTNKRDRSSGQITAPRQ
jgi:hypothetical protein